MTPRQIMKKLEAHLTIIDLEYIKCRRDEVEVFVPDDESLRHADYEATEKLRKKVSKVLPWGGFRTGYGSWILSKGYASDMGDWNDKSSKWHY